MIKTLSKRLLPLLLSVIMIFTVVPVQVFASSTTVSNELAIEDFDTFIMYLYFLEEVANMYVDENPGKDPVELMIKYIRTGVDRYNSGSWGIMAGYEDADFANFVVEIQEMINSEEPDPSMHLYITSLKNIECFYLPNGDYVDFGHMFGTMDITYHNKGSISHADVGGWAGDLVDLLDMTDEFEPTGTLEELVKEVSEKYLFKVYDIEGLSTFSKTDYYGDLDALILMDTINSVDYEFGVFTETFESYFTDEIDDESRAEYFLKNRLGGVSTRSNVRDAVYNAYIGNKVITTLEATREFNTYDLTDLRKAVCYAFADYVCKLAGDYVESTDNPYYSTFSSTSSNLAPGITQEIKFATSADNKQMAYYIATADLNRDDVHIFANYKDNDPTLGWGMQRVIDQANAAQNKYGNPESEDYIENYNVIVSTNGAGFNITTGEPSGVLVMGGVEYHAINSNGFFGILKDGTPIIASTEEYNTKYKGQVQEAIACFGATLVKDGKIAVKHTDTYYNDRASRTAVGITKTGKVVLMVLDGRQEPFSCGGSMIEIAQIMLDAGCVNAVNLDGGGSTTFVARQEGEDELSLVNRPSDGGQRSVSTSLMMVSTAPSSTAFDHAVIESEYDYLTVGSSVTLKASGISATGNEAILPEDISWALSNDTVGTLSDDGVFTAVSEGDVDVYLMSDGAIVGSKTLNVVIPQTVYFTKENVNAVYGSSVALPVAALYNNKKVAINTSDVEFTLSNNAGAVSGFDFIAKASSKYKSTVVVATLTNNPEATGSITVNLYNQGEMTFDFDKATGGDRQLAWYREVSNSITEDDKTYTAIDVDKNMVTSYTVAMDMRNLPIPARLDELTGLLPGADLEGASAWTFLLSLAERISVLTTVTATLNFDKNFDVDYSNIKLVNEYFELETIKFDEETNTLTITMRWIDQTAAINAETANPMCIVNGIKLTPKADADWGKNNRLNIVNSGNIGYDVYMRASALYTFATKEENQLAFGVYPFVNPNDPSEKGGHFGEIYKHFNDKYYLVNALKNGWYNEAGSFAYYENGEKYTGIHKIDGYYYDFGENGLCHGQTKFTGVFFDDQAGAYRYSKLGELADGWNMINDEWYYFDPSTKNAYTGEHKMGVVTYNFEETGKISSGVWAKTIFGMRYYYGPSYHHKGWYNIDGKDYFFENTLRYENGYRLVSQSNSTKRWYRFEADGTCNKDEYIPDGFYTDPKGTGYSKDGVALIGLHYIDGAYYCFSDYGYARTGTYGGYYFGDDYKAYTGIIEKNGVSYYYLNGKPNMAGLVEVDGDYYFAKNADGLCATGKYYVWQGNGILPEGNYVFGADGKLLDGIVEDNGNYYYYDMGRTKVAGLIEVDGDYYFVKNNEGLCVTGKYYVWQGNGILPEGNYEFGADGKMLTGVVEKNGNYYYYDMGKPKAAGLVEVDGSYYFARNAEGLCVTGKYYVWQGNGILPEGNYEFGTDGKMLNGIVEKDGNYYYYDIGKPKMAGLVIVDGDYYFARTAEGLCVTGKYYVWQGNGILPEGNYEFGADGKMLDGIVEKGGNYYYYDMGKPKMAGLIEVDGAYYFAKNADGLCVTGKYYVWQGNGILPESNYEFGADGKMLNGIVEKDGNYYYYDMGKPKMAGLIEVDGAYYFAKNADGLCVTGTYYVWQGNGILPEGNYEFGADGKMYNGFITKGDSIYYYENGRVGKTGLNYIDGYYYFIHSQGEIIVNRTYYVWDTNGYTIEMNYVFDELGRIIG